MVFEIEAAGRLHAVAVDVDRGRDGHLTVTIDGVPAAVDIRRTAGGYSLVLDGHVVEVAITDGDTRGELVVHLPAVSVPVSIDASRRRGKTARHADGEQRITAPMPGRIVRVLAKVGDDVELRQPVIVIEAMKMENELRAPKAGRVKEVAVETGASVVAGRLLVVIE
ncbi:MAG: hypothetical protein M3Q55_13180 [Acidobacteriota bacterium]|nr:hypothetical protein [Acidobacteriota bacterium]